MKIKRGDTVKVITGTDKGKTGKVLFVDHGKNRAIVEGVNMVTKHQKPNRSNQRGGIMHKEAPIHVSNLMYLHQNKPTRIGYKLQQIEIDGRTKFKKQRIAIISGEVID